jgi:hypothetical protein
VRFYIWQLCLKCLCSGAIFLLCQVESISRRGRSPLSKRPRSVAAASALAAGGLDQWHKRCRRRKSLVISMLSLSLPLFFLSLSLSLPLPLPLPLFLSLFLFLLLSLSFSFFFLSLSLSLSLPLSLSPVLKLLLHSRLDRLSVLHPPTLLFYCVSLTVQRGRQCHLFALSI